MKKNFLLLFCFISSLVFSQYSFDYKFLVKDSNKKKNNKDFFDTEILINTNEPNYFLYHYKDDEIRLFDYRKNMTIYLSDKSKNNEVIYKYLSHGGFVERESRETEFIEIKEIEKETFTIKTFKSEKDKANFELKVMLQKSETDLLYFYKLDLGNMTPKKILKAFREKLISLYGNSNFIITEMKADYKNGFFQNVKLVKYENINRVIR
ncbi:hypothetical protein [Chryseobacterium sp. YIM B08800]|uniref:hypothetical protein n=1 Tax=Chryseobacterium sp. YIM B08800 TaxID=2984136 RepID=UPI00223F047D|nr:hypothetical protein [Chryseobacterium sp. YIM B08800]